MPDISMCSYTPCPKRSGCYRYRAIPNEHRQSYFMGKPPHGEDGECHHFAPVRERDRLVPTAQADRRLAEAGTVEP